ncbi:MAG TPA: hypothetical protein VE621_12650 [Bryobacteraceae bacterium]|jgi:hypothetical protein|nr:hypothetical protein [Bryobacteraceae bacterium]
MTTINQEQFEALCDEVWEHAPEILHNVKDETEATERLLRAVFVRVCEHLGLSPEEEERALDENAAFRLMQTLEEHMQPEFSYSSILDDRILMRIHERHEIR